MESEKAPAYMALEQMGASVTGTAGPSAARQRKIETGAAEGDQVTVEARPGPVLLQAARPGSEIAGGPMVIPKIIHGQNKSFCFASYEAFRNRKGATATSATVPTSEIASLALAKSCFFPVDLSPPLR